MTSASLILPAAFGPFLQHSLPYPNKSPLPPHQGTRQPFPPLFCCGLTCPCRPWPSCCQKTCLWAVDWNPCLHICTSQSGVHLWKIRIPQIGRDGTGSGQAAPQLSCPPAHTSQRIVGIEPNPKVSEAGQEFGLHLAGCGVVHALRWKEGQEGRMREQALAKSPFSPNIRVAN